MRKIIFAIVIFTLTSCAGNEFGLLKDTGTLKTCRRTSIFNRITITDQKYNIYQFSIRPNSDGRNSIDLYHTNADYIIRKPKNYLDSNSDIIDNFKLNPNSTYTVENSSVLAASTNEIIFTTDANIKIISIDDRGSGCK